MPITFACPACRSVMSISRAYAGKQGRCPQCRAVIRVPDVPPTEEPGARSDRLPPFEEVPAPEEPRRTGTSGRVKPIAPPSTRHQVRPRGPPSPATRTHAEASISSRRDGCGTAPARPGERAFGNALGCVAGAVVVIGIMVVFFALAEKFSDTRSWNRGNANRFTMVVFIIAVSVGESARRALARSFRWRQ